MTNRKPFQNLPASENPQFLEDGKKIYLEMKKKYPNQSNEDLDNILNGICAALTCLMWDHIDKDNQLYFLQLIHNVLSKNVKK
jgi:hypothetical protein